MPTQIIPGLWCGGRPSAYASKYDLVICCEDKIRPERDPGFRGMVVHVPMKDSEDFDPDPVQCNGAAELAHAFLLADRRVFIHCAAGVNRTGVVAALTLTRFGYKPQAAIDLLREVRPGMLFNQRFCRFITEEAG